MSCYSSFKRPFIVIALAGAVSSLAASSSAFTLIPQELFKMSTGDPAPADGPSETANRPRYSVSDDGCSIVFTSTAKNLLPGQVETNGESDVFLYNACTFPPEVVALVSHEDGDPRVTSNGRSDQPVISPDGEFVVFRSTATNIIEGTGFSLTRTNIFLWERDTDTFQLASRGTGGANESGDGSSQNAVISRNPPSTDEGPFVAFESVAKNLVAPDNNGASDVFRFDGTTSTVVRVSIPNATLPQTEADGGSFLPVINGAGDCVVFESQATNLVSDDPAADDQNGPLGDGAGLDVFRWRPNGTILLSHTAGAPNTGRGARTGDGESSEASVDDGCRRFAFKSTAKDLMKGQNDGNGGTDVFHSEDTGDAVLASHQDLQPLVAGSGVSEAPILSRDGAWIAYASLAKDLSPGQIDNNGVSDVFIHEIGGRNTLASHLAGDPKTTGGGKSYAPEISNDGLYTAFESDAKDLDPNQNDGNGASDVFLFYNRLGNNALVVSRRFASIAIGGNGPSFRPALSGLGSLVAFTSRSSDLIADDPETSGFDDTFFLRLFPFVPFMSARSTASTHTVEWVTPPVDYVRMELWVNAGACPIDYAGAATQLVAAPSPPANAIGKFDDLTVYPSATTNCYSIFVERDDDGGAIPSGVGPAQTIFARTLEAAGSQVLWASNLDDVVALAQVGIGAQNLIAVTNFGSVFGVSRGATGGFWSSSYRPFRVFPFAPIQGRPPVVSVLGATRMTFVGSQDGRVYGYNADIGAGVGEGGARWYTSPVLGSSGVQPGMVGMFTGFGGIENHLLVGARTGTASQFFALDPFTGAQRAGSPYAGPPTIGAISTAASVDYARDQVYFASLEFSAGQPSLWCLQLTLGGFGSTCWSPQLLPASISGGPVERNGIVYVGDNLGQVWAFDAALGTLDWGPFALCGGGDPIKSFVLADRLGTAQDLFYATSTATCAVTDTGTLPLAAKWAISNSAFPAGIPGPSAPIVARLGVSTYVYVGSSDGHLYQINADTGAFTRVLIRTGGTVGAAAFDVRDGMIYVGTDAGAIYAVQAPLP